MIDELEQESVVEAEPQLDEGIGLKLQEVRNLLAAKHDTLVSSDDPILMLVTVCNAFLTEIEKTHSKYEKALGKLMVAETEKYLQAIKELSGHLSSLTIEGLQKSAEEHGKALAGTKRDLYWLSGLIVLSAIINAVIYWVK